MCHKIYIKKGIIEKPFASYKCHSKRFYYKNTFIYATPRNNKTECYDGSDEPEGDSSVSNIILASTSAAILLMYIALKYSGKLLKKMLSKNQSRNVNNGGDENIMQDFDMSFLNTIHINNYKENHDKEDTIDMTNIHILNSINTQTVEDNKETCILFYNLEEEIHGKNESEIHMCLHKKLDPKVVENILDSKFPGCTAGCIKCLEDLADRRFIMDLQDKITKSEISKEIIGTTFGIIKVEAKYIDLFKDTALSIVMLQAVGNFEAIINLPTNFGCVIVMLMFSSILIPLFLSTLHLVVNRKKILDEENFSKIRKYIIISFCWILSFLNPIILDAFYHELKEDIRKMTQNYNDEAMTIVKKCRNIKKEIVQFHKIELG